MMQAALPRRTYIGAGAALSLGVLALSMIAGKRRLARFSSRLTGAFVGKWSDLRLEKKVGDLLAKADAEGRDATPDIVRLWSRP